MSNRDLQTLGMTLVIIGLFVTERIVAYPLIGAGVLLSVISAKNQGKK